MRKFDSTESRSALVGVVDVARWEQYGLGASLPFQAMWYTVPPGSSSPRDCHPEVELSLVMTGRAVVETAAGSTEVRPGSAFLLDSREAHVVHNRSTDTPLLVFSAYWMPTGVDPADTDRPVDAGAGHD